MTFSHAAADLGMKMMNHIHRSIRVVSGGRLGNRVFGMTTVELRTVGRTSGQSRRVLLTAPVHDDGRTVLVASKGGDDRHPDWYLNLVADPDVELTIDGRSFPMRARTASGPERAELWPTIVGRYGGYAGYQKRTDREIPVVVCEPR